ncbi:MAG: hypothetical protein ACFCAD_10545 [Pleurocapsa sp.]
MKLTVVWLKSLRLISLLLAIQIPAKSVLAENKNQPVIIDKPHICVEDISTTIDEIINRPE